MGCKTHRGDTTGATPHRRTQLEQDDEAWLRWYHPDVFYNPFTDDQKETIHECGQVLRFGVQRATAAPRGDGKSTIIKYLAEKYALEGIVKFVLILASQAGKATKIARSVLRDKLASKRRSTWELQQAKAEGADIKGIEPNRLADDYPLQCFVARHVAPWPSRANNVTANGGRSVHLEWGASHCVLPTWEDEPGIGSIFLALGWQSEELQGCNILDIRPDFVILDDLDSRKSLASEDGKIAEQIEECIEKNVGGLSGQSRQLGQYMLCTITSRDSAAFKYTDPEQKPAWGGRRVRAVKSWPKDMALSHEYIEMRQYDKSEFHIESRTWYEKNKRKIEAGVIVSNPFNFESQELPDGKPKELSNYQRCLNFIADKSWESFNTEYQNDPPESLAASLESKLTRDIVTESQTDLPRKSVVPATDIITRGADIRKTQIHHGSIARDEERFHRIVDYNVASFGHVETTVQQAEQLILDNLMLLRDEWELESFIDSHGQRHYCELTLIDKGWMGSWQEKRGEHMVTKTWASQPVETFCMEAGLDRYLPAKGAPRYTSPAPNTNVIIGDNWHINLGPGKDRKCHEVIWSAEHWHQLVEELFMLPADDPERFILFAPEDDIWHRHRAFANHMTEGARLMRDKIAGGKHRFVHDHWWDSMAQALVARSVAEVLRERRRRKRQKQSQPQHTPQRESRTPSRRRLNHSRR